MKFDEQLLTEEFRILTRRVEEEFSRQPEAFQIMALMTRKGSVHSVIHSTLEEATHNGDHPIFDRLAQENDREVAYLVCRMQGSHAELPSWNFREKLLTLSPENADTKVLVQTIGGYAVKRFKDLMP